MIIEKNKVVSLVYELRVNGTDGEVVEALNEERPLTFIFGSGTLLPKFETNINGLKVNDAFNFELKCQDAYGMETEDAIVNIPKNVFIVDGVFDHQLVQIGNSIPMMDNQGNRLNGLVLSIDEESIKMDFNHPLAGDDLFFKGKVVEVREATEEELSHGHIHGQSACGSGCGSDCGDSGESSSCCGGSGCH